MDVTLPDGSVLTDVPDGTTKWQLAERLYRAGDKENSHQLILQDAKERPWGSGAAKFAYELGGKATDLASRMGASPEVAAGVGTAANFFTHAIPALLTGGKIAPAAVPGAIPGAAPAMPGAAGVGPVLEGPARSLMQGAFKPDRADLVSGKAQRAIGTMLEEGVNPTESGMVKANDIARTMNQRVENAIANSGEMVNIPRVGGYLRDLYNNARTQANPTADMNAVRTAWDEFYNSPLVNRALEIPVQVAQAIKKGTYRALGEKPYGELAGTSTEAQKQLARGLREGVIAKVPEIAEPLKREADMMNILEVASAKAAMQGNLNPVGLASLRFDSPIPAIATWLDRARAIQAGGAQALYSGSRPEVLGPLGILAGEQERVR